MFATVHVQILGCNHFLFFFFVEHKIEVSCFRPPSFWQYIFFSTEGARSVYGNEAIGEVTFDSGISWSAELSNTS